MAATSRRTVQQHLDSRIELLERELLDLKQQRNNMSPISSLPPEILCEILLLATTCHDPEKYIGDLPDRLRIKGFFGVLGHVSHSWRTFALECPYLWADVDVGMNTDARRVEFQAKHALPHPLSLCVKGALATTSGPRPERPKAFDALQRILSETKLFEKLAIEGDVYLLSDLLETTRPERLYDLQIAVLSHGKSQSMYSAAGALLAKHPAFANETLGSHSLTVLGCSIPFMTPILSHSQTLTTLYMTIHHDVMVSPFLDVFRKLPQLEQLRLEFKSPLKPPHDITFHPVPLPHLSHLGLRGDAHSLITTLSHMRLSAMLLDAAFVCELFSHEDPRQARADVLRALAEAREPPEAIRMKLTSNRSFAPYLLLFGLPPSAALEGIYAITMGNWAQDIPQRSPLTVVRLGVEDSITGSFIDPERWHPFLLTRHPKDAQESIGWSLDELDVCAFLDDKEYTDSFWLFLAECPRISQISLSTQQALKFLPLLYTEHIPFPFPTLRHVGVGVVTPVRKPGSRGASPEPNCDSILEAFLDALAKRQILFSKPEYGSGDCGLDTLTLMDFPCPPKGNLVEEAQSRRLIGRVEW